MSKLVLFNVAIFLIGDGSFSEKEPSPMSKYPEYSGLNYLDMASGIFFSQN